MTISDGCMGQGHVSRALANVVLPMFWQENRQSQSVTFQDIEAGERFARRLGFEISQPGRGKTDLSVYAGAPTIEARKRPLSRGEFDAMGIDIDRAKLYLKMVNDRLQLAYGDVERLGLEHLIYADVGQARRWRQQNRRER